MESENDQMNSLRDKILLDIDEEIDLSFNESRENGEYLSGYAYRKGLVVAREIIERVLETK